MTQAHEMFHVKHFYIKNGTPRYYSISGRSHVHQMVNYNRMAVKQCAL